MQASSSWIGCPPATPRRARDTAPKPCSVLSCSVFAAFANVGYDHEYSATDYAQPASKPSNTAKRLWATSLRSPCRSRPHRRKSKPRGLLRRSSKPPPRGRLPVRSSDGNRLVRAGTLPILSAAARSPPRRCATPGGTVVRKRCSDAAMKRHLGAALGGSRSGRACRPRSGCGSPQPTAQRTTANLAAVPHTSQTRSDPPTQPRCSPGDQSPIAARSLPSRDVRKRCSIPPSVGSSQPDRTAHTPISFHPPFAPAGGLTGILSQEAAVLLGSDSRLLGGWPRGRVGDGLDVLRTAGRRRPGSRASATVSSAAARSEANLSP